MRIAMEMHNTFWKRAVFSEIFVSGLLSSLYLHLYDTRHTPLDARLSQTRDNHRRILLRSSSENREELCNSAFGPIRLFDQVYRHTPPGKQCREHPKVCGYLDADPYTVSVREEAASDCCANGEGEEEGCENNVTGACCDCLSCDLNQHLQSRMKGREMPNLHRPK
jgi:hypothetical protein